MKKKDYRITIYGKLIIFQFLIGLIGVLCGFSWKIYTENKKWDCLIYPEIIVENVDITGTTKSEAKELVMLNYIQQLLNKKLNIIASDKIYILDYSKVIEGTNIDSIIDEAFEKGKDLNFYDKHKVRKENVVDRFDITFKYNEKYIKSFIENIEKDVNVDPLNATIKIISNEKVEVLKDVRGSKLNTKQLDKLIRESITSELTSIQAPIELIEAPVTARELSCIDTKITSFSTSFISSSNQRIKNIELATNAISGKVIMPGEIFSFNDCVGERTKEKGYMEASVIENGKSVKGIGGGICQVSSTLYNCVLKSGLNPIERRNHTIPVSYVGLGQDATVNWNNIDLKFQNNFEYPILIGAYTENKNLFIDIYSNNSLTNKDYVIIKDVDTIIKSNGYYSNKPQGYKVTVKRNVYEKGILINSQFVSNDFYKLSNSNTNKLKSKK